MSVKLKAFSMYTRNVKFFFKTSSKRELFIDIIYLFELELKRGQLQT